MNVLKLLGICLLFVTFLPACNSGLRREERRQGDEPFQDTIEYHNTMIRAHQLYNAGNYSAAYGQFDAADKIAERLLNAANRSRNTLQPVSGLENTLLQNAASAAQTEARKMRQLCRHRLGNPDAIPTGEP